MNLNPLPALRQLLAVRGVSRQALTAPLIVQNFNALILSSDFDEVLRRAGQTRQILRGVACDDEVSAALETRLNGVLSTPWRIEPGEGPAHEFLHDQMRQWLPDLVRALWQAVPYGYSVSEMVYQDLADGRLGIAAAQPLPFEDFRIAQDGRIQSFSGRIIPDDILNGGERILLVRRNPSYRQPHGEALLAAVYWPWHYRTHGYRFWARFLERFGAPLIVGKVRAGMDASGSSYADLMLDHLAAAVNSASLVIDKDDEVQAIAPGGNGESFRAFALEMAQRIQKVILGQTLTTQMSDSGGSFAAAQVHNEVRDDRRLADIRLLLPALNGVLATLARINFPGAPAPILVMEDGRGLEAERATRDATLAQAGIARFSKAYLLRAYDYDPEDVDVPDAAAPPDPNADPGDPSSGFAAFPGVAMAPHKPDGPPRRFTRAQRRVEALADTAIAAAGPPIDPALIRRAVLAATSPEDLADRLGLLLRDQPSARFQAALDQALYAADILGYVAAAGDATPGSEPLLPGDPGDAGDAGAAP